MLLVWVSGTTNCLRQRRCWWNLLVGLASSSVGVKVARRQEEQAASMDRQVKSKDAVMVKSSPVNVTKAENGSKLVLENFSLLSDCIF